MKAAGHNQVSSEEQARGGSVDNTVLDIPGDLMRSRHYY